VATAEVSDELRGELRAESDMSGLDVLLSLAVAVKASPCRPAGAKRNAIKESRIF